MNQRMLATLTLLLSATAVGLPADEVRAAVADVEQLPAELRPQTRYLTLYNIAPAERQEAVQVISYVLNALSSARAITPPVPVTPTLVRFSINQYAVSDDDAAAWTAAWEKLALGDPYFHLRTEVLAVAQSGGKGGQTARTKSTKTDRPTQTVTTDGGWIDLDAAPRLRAATGSAGALLRADYFVAAATSTPSYYEFANVPATENEFLKSLGVDQAAIDRLRANAGANLAVSGVTAKPRRIVWTQGPLGGVYSTLDVERVDAERDPLRRPISARFPLNSETNHGNAAPATGLFAFHYDLGEWFAIAPNGLWRTALFNAAGRRQDAVPDRVAKDTSDPLGDGIVVPLISCIRCHREAGLRPFVDDQTRLFAAGVNLFSTDPKIVQRAAEFYDEPRLSRQMEFDRQTYTAVVAQATGGMKPEQLATSLATVVREYAYLPVTEERAAAEVGLCVDDFRRALSATRDPVILLLLQDRPVLRGQWESSFAEAALVAASFRAAVP